MNKDLDKEKTKEDVIAIKNLRLEILERENQKLESEYQALVAKTHQYDKLVEKVKEFFVAYHAEETETGEYDEDGFPKTNGLELDEKFKVIAEELKAMVGYKNE